MYKDILTAFKPEGASVTFKLRQAGAFACNGAGVTTSCLSLGAVTTAQADFVSM